MKIYESVVDKIDVLEIPEENIVTLDSKVLNLLKLYYFKTLGTDVVLKYIMPLVPDNVKTIFMYENKIVAIDKYALLDFDNNITFLDKELQYVFDENKLKQILSNTNTYENRKIIFVMDIPNNEMNKFQDDVINLVDVLLDLHEDNNFYRNYFLHLVPTIIYEPEIRIHKENAYKEISAILVFYNELITREDLCRKYSNNYDLIKNSIEKVLDNNKE